MSARQIMKADPSWIDVWRVAGTLNKQGNKLHCRVCLLCQRHWRGCDLSLPYCVSPRTVFHISFACYQGSGDCLWSLWWTYGFMSWCVFVCPICLIEKDKQSNNLPINQPTCNRFSSFCDRRAQLSWKCCWSKSLWRPQCHYWDVVSSKGSANGCEYRSIVRVWLFLLVSIFDRFEVWVRLLFVLWKMWRYHCLIGTRADMNCLVIFLAKEHACFVYYLY